mgnify:CR=1 FL=1
MAAPAEVGCDLKPFKGALLVMAVCGLLRAETYYLTIAGLGGEQEYEQRFSGWASEIDKILKGEPGAKVTTLSGAQATRANIETRLNELAKQAKADDSVVLILIGHGSSDESDDKFNIPGHDRPATRMAPLPDKIPPHTRAGHTPARPAAVRPTPSTRRSPISTRPRPTS